jgi:hypothetical protein
MKNTIRLIRLVKQDEVEKQSSILLKKVRRDFLLNCMEKNCGHGNSMHQKLGGSLNSRIKRRSLSS